MISRKVHPVFRGEHCRILLRVALAAGSLEIGTAWATVLPPNDLYLQDGLGKSSIVPRERFDGIVDEVERFYVPVAKQFGKNFVINRYWDNSWVNANADQEGDTWLLNVYGGLARRPELTEDAFALILCHELGHHFGGFAFYPDADLSWGSVEGEADYYSTHFCARYLWKDDIPGNVSSQAQVTPAEKTTCDSVWLRVADQDLCYRTLVAARSVAALYARTNGTRIPSLQTPDPSSVRETSSSHPNPQCRYDTIVAGALCNTSFDPTIVPGKNHPNGQGSLAAQSVAFDHSCAAKRHAVKGVRPSCWFKEK